jgi:hypothetical protein
VRCRAAAVAEETGLSGIDGGGGDQQSREPQGGLLFIGSKQSATVLN